MRQSLCLSLRFIVLLLFNNEEYVFKKMSVYLKVQIFTLLCVVETECRISTLDSAEHSTILTDVLL